MTLVRLIAQSPSTQTTTQQQPSPTNTTASAPSHPSPTTATTTTTTQTQTPMPTNPTPTSTTSTTTTTTTTTSSPPLEPLPPNLQAAIQASREAETLHAYDVGVCAALQSMQQHWTTRAAQRHVSIQEKRIFRREAQRLRELLGDAQKDMMASDRRLATKQDEERRLWGEFTRLCCASAGTHAWRGGEKRGGGTDMERVFVGVKQRVREMEEVEGGGRGTEDVGELVEGISLLSLGGGGGGGLEKKKKGCVRVEEVECCEDWEGRRESVRERFGELIREGERRDGVKC